MLKPLFLAGLLAVSLTLGSSGAGSANKTESVIAPELSPPVCEVTKVEKIITDTTTEIITTPFDVTDVEVKISPIEAAEILREKTHYVEIWEIKLMDNENAPGKAWGISFSGEISKGDHRYGMVFVDAITGELSLGCMSQ